MNIDFSAIFAPVIEALLVAIATALTALIVTQIRLGIQRLKDVYPGKYDLIMDAAEYAVKIVEQMKRRGDIPADLPNIAKDKAVQIAEALLRAKGVNFELDEYADIILDAIEYQVSRMNDGKPILKG